MCATVEGGAVPGARASCVTPARSLPALSPCSKFIGHIDIVIAPGVDDDDDDDVDVDVDVDVDDYDDEGLCWQLVAAPSSSKSTCRHCHRSCGTELLAACSSETSQGQTQRFQPPENIQIFGLHKRWPYGGTVFTRSSK